MVQISMRDARIFSGRAPSDFGISDAGQPIILRVPDVGSERGNAKQWKQWLLEWAAYQRRGDSAVRACVFAAASRFAYVVRMQAMRLRLLLQVGRINRPYRWPRAVAQL